MADIKDWMSLSKPDAEWEQSVKDNMGGQPPDLGMFPDIASMRDWILKSKQAMTAEMGPSIPGVKEEDKLVEMRDGEKIVCRIYRPETAPAKGGPLVIIYHGGGWCIGGLDNEEYLCRKLTATFAATCINIDYRLAPEYKFPTAINDCFDATKWAASNAAIIGADPTKGFIIGGTSAGGNMVATVAHLWRDEEIKPPITGCVLTIPAWVDHTAVPEKYQADYRSWEQNSKAPILSREAVDLFLDNYIPNKEDRKNPLFSPMLWETGQKDLPPSVFQICGQDPLRDEGLIMERHMREDLGIKTKLYMYPGQPHGFHSVSPTMKASQKFVQDSIDAVGWLLGKGSDQPDVEHLEFF